MQTIQPMPRMKRIIKTTQSKIGLFATLALVAFAAPTSAHPPGSDDDHHHDAVTQTWHDLRKGVQYEASLMNVRADGVTIQLDDGALVNIPMADLSQDDRAQAESKLVVVRAMNEYSFAPPTPAVTKAPTTSTPSRAVQFRQTTHTHSRPPTKARDRHTTTCRSPSSATSYRNFDNVHRQPRHGFKLRRLAVLFRRG